MPKRVKIDWRVKGGKKPLDTIIVARPSRWGNPFVIGAPGVPDAQAAVDWFIETTPHWRPEVISELRGYDLACYCDLDQPCHADALLEFANGPLGETDTKLEEK